MNITTAREYANHFCCNPVEGRAKRMKLLKPIPYGYKAFTGVTLSDGAVDSYNAQTEKCNSYIREGFEVPERILNGKHNLFCAIAEAL